MTSLTFYFNFDHQYSLNKLVNYSKIYTITRMYFIFNLYFYQSTKISLEKTNSLMNEKSQYYYIFENGGRTSLGAVVRCFSLSLSLV
jgi:hypothetical protein